MAQNAVNSKKESEIEVPKQVIHCMYLYDPFILPFNLQRERRRQLLDLKLRNFQELAISEDFLDSNHVTDFALSQNSYISCVSFNENEGNEICCGGVDGRIRIHCFQSFLRESIPSYNFNNFKQYQSDQEENISKDETATNSLHEEIEATSINSVSYDPLIMNDPIVALNL